MRIFEYIKNIVEMILHVLKLDAIEFPVYTLDFASNGMSIVLYATRYCRKCGKTKRVTKGDEFRECCGMTTALVKEKKRDALIRNFLNLFNLDPRDFCRIQMSESVLKKFTSELIERRKSGHTYMLGIQNDIGMALMAASVYPFGKSARGRSWACKPKSLGPVLNFFDGKMPNDGHLLFSDFFHRIMRPVRVMYDTSYEIATGCDGHAIAKKSLVGDGRQFRLMNKKCLAKGLAVGVTDDKLDGCDIIVGSNCVKIGKRHLKDGDKFIAWMGLMNMDKPRRGCPGWEPIMFLKNTKKVHTFMNALVDREVRKLAEELFNSDREALIARFDRGETQDEKSYPWEVQVLRSNLPMDHPMLGKALTQIFLNECSKIVMGGGIFSKLRCAKIDDRIPEEKLTCYAIRVPFIGGKRAIIRCTRDGWTTSKYMNDNSGMDDDGDRIGIIAHDIGVFLEENMKDIGKLEMPAGFEVKRDESLADGRTMVMKYLNQTEGPDIGIPCSVLIRDLAIGNMKAARRSASAAHFSAQLLKKNMFDVAGNMMTSDDFLNMFDMSQYDRKDMKRLNFARAWFAELTDRRKNKKALSINHFAMAVMEVLDINGKNRYPDFRPYDAKRNVGVLNRRVYEGCKIVVDIYNEYGIQDKFNRPAKFSISDDMAALIAPYKKAWKKRTFEIRKMEREGAHTEVVKMSRAVLRERMRDAGAKMDLDCALAMIYDALNTGTYALADIMLPEAVGFYTGYCDCVMDNEACDVPDVELSL